MKHAMITRRQVASRRQLLHLPDELLSQIIVETMWECTLPESLKELPDVEGYQRRLTNHPSLRPQRIAFLGSICGRLRRIFIELQSQPSLWTSPRWPWRKTPPSNRGRKARETAAAASLDNPKLRAVTLVEKELSYLPLMSKGTLEGLTELELFGRAVDADISEMPPACPGLRTLHLHDIDRPVPSSEDPFVTLLRALGQLSDLRHLTIHRLEGIGAIAPAPFITLVDSWTSSCRITRLEITHVFPVTFTHFIRLMGCCATTVVVAIFTAFDNDYDEPMLALSEMGEVKSFPALVRLSIAFCADDQFAHAHDRTQAGHRQLAVLSPLKIVQAAPSIAYFDCSERLRIKNKSELNEVAKLVDREGWKRLRLKLKTWRGNKGGRWTIKEHQEVVVG